MISNRSSFPFCGGGHAKWLGGVMRWHSFYEVQQTRHSTTLPISHLLLIFSRDYFMYFFFPPSLSFLLSNTAQLGYVTLRRFATYFRRAARWRNTRTVAVCVISLSMVFLLLPLRLLLLRLLTVVAAGSHQARFFFFSFWERLVSLIPWVPEQMGNSPIIRQGQ